MSRPRVIFLDSSVAVHAAGSIGYTWAVQVFQAPPEAGVTLVTDTLCIQEVDDLVARLSGTVSARHAVSALQAAVDSVLSVTAEDFDAVPAIAREVPGLSPREGCHVAVMRRFGATAVCSSWETGYERVPGLDVVYLLNDPRLSEGTGGGA